MLKSPIFARLPVANIQRLFAAMEAVEQSVIQQGDVADACYVIKVRAVRGAAPPLSRRARV
jgi:hypothetical protein